MADETTTTTTEPTEQGAMPDLTAEVEKWKAMSRKNEAQAKANAEKANKYDELLKEQEAAKSDFDKLNERIATLEANNAEKDAQLLKAQIAQETGVPADMLVGATAEELTACAERINKFAESKAPQGYPADKGGAGKAHTMSKADILAIKDPKARRAAIGANIDLF